MSAPAIAERPSLRAQSLDGIVNRFNWDLTETAAPLKCPPDIPGPGRDAESSDAREAMKHQGSRDHFCNNVTEVEAVTGTRLPKSEGSFHNNVMEIEVVPATSPKPATRSRDYFSETPAERRERLDAARTERRKNWNRETARCLAEDDQSSLFDVTRGMITHYVRRMQIRYEFDQSTFDDLAQAGAIGLWNAIRTYREDGGAEFRTYATKCVFNALWLEFDNLMRHKKRYRQHCEDWESDILSEDTGELDLETRELIGVMLRKFRELPGNTPLILQARASGKRLKDIANYLGMSEAGIHKRFHWALEEMQSMVLPLVLGALYPNPCELQNVWSDLAYEPLEDDGVPVDERHCEMCDADISHMNANAIYCSHKCCKAAFKRRRALEAKAA